MLPLEATSTLFANLLGSTIVVWALANGIPPCLAKLILRTMESRLRRCPSSYRTILQLGLAAPLALESLPMGTLLRSPGARRRAT